MPAKHQFRYTVPQLSFSAGPGDPVVILPQSKLVAYMDCVFHAQPKSFFDAHNGATGFVQQGSVGLARAGSKIYSRTGGAVILAMKGSWVRAGDGDHVFAETGAEIVGTAKTQTVYLKECPPLGMFDLAQSVDGFDWHQAPRRLD